MKASVNLRPRVVPNSCVHVIRKIKGSGSLTVAKGQEVSPHDILGTSLLSPGFTVINLSRELHLSATNAIKALKKTVGVPIYKGELLAQKKSLFGSQNIIAPTDCVIDKVNQTTGEITLKLLPKKIPLLSGVFGIVDMVNTLTGEVFIKTMATQIVGIYGSGRERGGFLRVVNNRGDLTDGRQILPDMKGQIIVAGGMVFDQTLKKSMEYQLDGVICGALNQDDYLSIAGSIYEAHKSHSEIGLSVVATEGFGPLSMGEDIFNTLKSADGKYAFINGFESTVILPDSLADSIIMARKIALPPPTGAYRSTPEMKTVELYIGQKVRLIWHPFMAGQGTVSSIDGSPTQLDSGVSAICATVDLPGRKIKVPISNLEAI